jgi:hypothetical protein
MTFVQIIEITTSRLCALPPPRSTQDHGMPGLPQSRSEHADQRKSMRSSKARSSADSGVRFLPTAGAELSRVPLADRQGAQAS